MNDSRKRALLVFLSCVAVVCVAFGTRQSFGLFMHPITVDMGWGREALALTFAVQSLVIGLMAPVAGAIADRWSPGKTIMVGGSLFAAGLVTMAIAQSPLAMLAGGGLLVGAGLSGCGLPLTLAVIGRIAPEDSRSLWLGVTTAASTGGQLVLVPLTQWAIGEFGWRGALYMLAALGMMIVPLAIAVARSRHQGLDNAAVQSLGEALVEARKHRGYLLLVLGFFVCGFHVQFIAIHFPAYIVDQGLAPALAATALVVIAGANAIGAWLAGWAGGHYRKRYLLSGIYFGRALVFVVMISIPMTPVSVVALSACIGFLWLGTVPLTSGIVAQVFGPRYMATLFALVYLSHQLGSFMGVWLGGRIYDATGSYDIVWWMTIALGLAASLIHLPIDDRPVARLARASS